MSTGTCSHKTNTNHVKHASEPQPPQPPHSVANLAQGVSPSVAARARCLSAQTLAGNMSDVACIGVAMSRRERLLRSTLRHERQTVAMELAAAHSRDGGRA